MSRIDIGIVRFDDHLSDKAIALPRERFEHQLGWVLALYYLTQARETARQGGLTDVGIWPTVVQQLRFRDHTITVVNEIQEDLEYFRLNGKALFPPPKLTALRMQHVVTKLVHHNLFDYLSSCDKGRAEHTVVTCFPRGPLSLLKPLEIYSKPLPLESRH